jgi:N-acyl-D-amino-acid deacylase
VTEILLSGGTLIDGTGNAPRGCDVLIRDGLIAGLGTIPANESMERIDCDGLVVAPGFIDAHSHGDHEVLEHLPNKILQGVTTEIVGNCGFSLFPTNRPLDRLTDDIFQGDSVPRMRSAAEYFEAIGRSRPLVNVAALTGHAALRGSVCEARADVTEGEMREMQMLLEDSLEAGSIGFSTGLNCMPSGFARREELVRLCSSLKKHGAYYATHMRDYKFKVVEAVDEAIGVARAAEASLQISHMQVVGHKNWDKLAVALEHIERATADSLDIAMDAYPYLAGCCSMIQLLPEWSQIGGISELLRRLTSPATRNRIERETDDNMSNTWDDIIVCDERKSLGGKSIALIAAERGRDGCETALDLLVEEAGHVFIISFNNNEQNLRQVLTHPLTSVITDGFVLKGISHPRTYGTYPKFLGEYVRDKKWMSLPEAILKTSALAARRFQLRGRGALTAGSHADVVVFDAARIGTRSDYSKPAQDPEGIHHVLVNGRLAVRNGRLTAERAGIAIRCAA